MKKGVLPSIAVVVVMLALTACAGNSAVIKSAMLPGGHALVTSAEVRAVHQIKTGNGSRMGRVHPDYVTCAEPSPDVAKAVASALNIGSSVGISGLPSGIDPKLALTLSRAYAESLAQLTQRLATIQLLRDGLYRACEAYANGAISDTTYAVLLSRYDDTMVTMLLGEFAAGAFGGSLAALGAGAEGTTSAALDLTDKQDKTREAEVHLKAAEKRRDERQAALERADATDGIVRNELEKNLEQDQKEVNKAFRELVEHLKAEASSSAKALQVIAAGGITASPNPQIAGTLHTMQRKFIENLNFDAMEVACISALDRGQTSSTVLADYCQRHILPQLEGIKGQLLQVVLERAREEKKTAEQRGRLIDTIEEMKTYIDATTKLFK